MSDQSQIQPPTNAAGPDLPKLVEQFLENQRQELALRQQQLELNKTHLEKSAEYAHEALKAEFSDRDKERAHQLKILQSVQRFIGVLILAVLIFLFIVFRIDKEAAAQLVKVIGYLAVLGGGYAIGRYRSKKSGNYHMSNRSG